MSSDPAWQAADSAELYRVADWGIGYFGVSESGRCLVHPGRHPDSGIDLLEVVEGLEKRGLTTPVVLRFPELLEDRLHQIRAAFDRAMEETGYGGGYRCVYPIKVNQQRSVCAEIARVGAGLGFGPEAGSKPELLAGLYLSQQYPDMPLVCNGFKDAEYIEMAILAAKMGRNVIPVVEQFSELEQIAKFAAEHDIVPRFGIRAKLGTGGVGRWAASSGFRGKFGLSAREILDAIEFVKDAGLIDGLGMLHCHIGSQIFDIRTVKYAVSELVNLYAEMVRLGAPMGYLDIGGGMGVDYDGTQSASDSSMNYTLEQYALDVVHRIGNACEEAGVEPPTIISESGRAVAAHSSLLICEVLGRRAFPEEPSESLIQRALDAESPPQPFLDILEAYRRLQGDGEVDLIELHSDALHALNETISLFNLGYTDLPTRAAAEELYAAIGIGLVQRSGDELPEDLAELRDQFADLYFTNFSLFQSLIDAWGIEQIFPIMPIHRLDERPDRRAILADITCDSDGKIDRFAGESGAEGSLPLHALRPLNGSGTGKAGFEPYYLGVFLTGAYQETLGDLHNLFGDTHTVLVTRTESGDWRLEDVIEGDSVASVLRYVQFDPEIMRRHLRRDVEDAHENGRITLDEVVSLQRFLDHAFQGYTYLE